MARTIGEAFVRVRADVSHTGGELRKDLTPQVDRAGKEQGRTFGDSFNNQVWGALRGLGVGLNRRISRMDVDTVEVPVKLDTRNAFAGLNPFRRRLGKEGEDAGVSFVSKLTAGIPGGLATSVTSSGPYVALALAGVAAAAAPAIGAALSGGILLAVGGGVFAAGIASAARDPKVKTAFGSLAAVGQGVFTEMGKAFRDPLVRAAGTFSGLLKDISPSLTAMSVAAAPIVDRLVPALADMVRNIMPGLKSAFDASLPLFQTLADVAPKLGGAISQFFGEVAKNGPAINTFLKDMLGFLVWTIPKVGWLLGALTSQYIAVRSTVIWVVKAVTAAWAALSSWFSGTIVPSWRRAVGSVTGFFSGLRDFVMVDVPGGFRAGVKAIGKAWDKLKSLAAVPVKFVIETVINKGVIDIFNNVSGFFHGPQVPHVAVPRGIGDGPGRPGIGGTGDGFGIKDVLKLFSGPGKWLAGKIGADRITSAFGDSPWAKILVGSVGALGSAALDRIKKFVTGGTELLGLRGGAGVSLGGLRPGILGVLAAMQNVFGNVPVISGFRAGARTLSGRRSYHALGRAIDIRPVFAWANFLSTVFGGRLRELITPWNFLNILNGRHHNYTGAVWNQHNFAGGNAHIHAAMDDYGTRTLRPGLNIIPNNTGRLEPIGALAGMQPVININIKESVIASKRQAVDLLVEAFNTAVLTRRINIPRLARGLR